jgi:homospermidine synthase
MTKVEFAGQIIILGLGSIGSGSVPLIFEHINIPPSRVQVVAASTNYAAVLEAYGLKYTETVIDENNYKSILVGQLKLSNGDFLVNLSLDVCALALIQLCHEIGALYIDTAIEPWYIDYTSVTLSWSARSNYFLREEIRDAIPTHAGGPTAIVAHGANPGLVNHFLKRALVELSEIVTGTKSSPSTRADWAALARDLGVKTIQISERDTQRPKEQKRRNEFVNTWSVDGFIEEGVYQPSEIGWGTHEKELPATGRHHGFGSDCAIYLEKPGVSVRVHGWTPLEGPYWGFLVTHNETLSIADYFTIRDTDGNLVYRPTSYSASHPCDAAVLSLHEILGHNLVVQDDKRLLQQDDILDGIDELGVLLLGDFGPGFSGYWHGSRLAHEDAIKVKFNQATSLQVTASVVAGIVWAIENPRAGIVEPDDLDYKRVLEITDPYTAPNISQKTDWNPGGKDFQIGQFIVD